MNTYQTVFENSYAKIDVLSKVIICTTKPSYVPTANFKEVFEQIEKFAKINMTKKLILDGRSLHAFHQSTMTWYYVDWRMSMLKYGLDTYRELVPNNDFMKKSVEIGKERLLKEYPAFNFERFDFKYCETLEEALED